MIHDSVAVAHYWFSPGEWHERPVNYAQGARATTKMNQQPFRSGLRPSSVTAIFRFLVLMEK
jgi:hypothetical protein